MFEEYSEETDGNDTGSTEHFSEDDDRDISDTESFCSDTSSVVSPEWESIEFDEDDEIVQTESPGMHTSTLF